MAATELTVDAVRMALNLNKLRAEVAGWNIVNASSVDAPMFVIDHSGTDALLQMAASDDPGAARDLLSDPSSPTMAIVDERYDAARSSLDELVADSVTAGLNYQSLTESLSRHFGLMRLAISGRSGA
jgi:flagellar basal-body rod protein FlgB